MDNIGGNMEIEVGNYVRTIDGYIRKVTQINRKGSYEGLCYGAYSVDKKYKNSVGISAKKIKTHSKNIIDLIEVGDYVNGEEVIALNQNGYAVCTEWSNGFDCYFGFNEEDVKTILTHEMYEQNCYKLKE